MKFILLLSLIFSASSAFAFPEAPFDALAKAHLKNNFPLDSMGYDFEGIVKLSNCSGSLIAYSGMPVTAKAIVMTNGHCFERWGGFLKPGEVILNKKVTRRMGLYDKNMKLHNIKSTKVVYATMTNTDLALYELDQSYAEILESTGVRPLLLDTVHPLANQSIEIISGYWDRGWSCDIDGFVFALKESNWTFTNSIRYTRTCDTIGGSSGSPIIAKGERKAIGVNNTANESGKRCAMNNPCEVSEEGEISVNSGATYGQQTYNVYTCLTPSFELDLSIAGCELPR